VTGSGSGSGNGSGGGSLAEFDGSLAADQTDPENVEDGCVAETQLAKLTPINLVFVFDKSGSMGDSYDADGLPLWENADLRWNPAKAAMTAFFQNPGAEEVYASLKFFPHRGGYDATCDKNNYLRPDVPLTSLEEPGPLLSLLDRTEPGGGTPTLPALMGAVSYAREQMTKTPGSKSIIVLVTDGEPVVVDSSTGEAISRTDNCPEGTENTIDNIAAVAEGAYNQTPSVPVYVIGIGVELGALTTIAAAGGTELMLIDDSTGEETQRQLLEALQMIQVRKLECDVQLPLPPAGQALDYEKVNVDFLHSDGTTEELGYDERCVGAGWRYDVPLPGGNPTADRPTKIELCESSCNSLQDDLDGQLQVVLGCAIRLL
jgi:Mg-chelatase subunit ChlD